VSEGTFQHHAALPQQILAAVSTNPQAIGIDGLLFFGFSNPMEKEAVFSDLSFTVSRIAPV
jgi:hypothetical protein